MEGVDVTGVLIELGDGVGVEEGEEKEGRMLQADKNNNEDIKIIAFVISLL